MGVGFQRSRPPGPHRPGGIAWERGRPEHKTYGSNLIQVGGTPALRNPMDSQVLIPFDVQFVSCPIRQKAP